MSAHLKPDPEDILHGQIETARKKPCSYCNKAVDYPFVWWRVYSKATVLGSGDLVLHPDCVLQLGVRLFRDVHQIQIGR